ncbi:hypothetical protein OG900_22615 [Streptomyces sp. NBC_00433]
MEANRTRASTNRGTASAHLCKVGRSDWLREPTADEGLTGFMLPTLPDAAWVLNAM